MSSEYNEKIDDSSESQTADTKNSALEDANSNSVSDAATGDDSVGDGGSKDDTQDAESDDEVADTQQLLASLELSADTMKALQEFLQEEKERQDKLQMIEQGNIPEDFEENWNLSQFWYRQDTADCLARESLRLAEAAAMESPVENQADRGAIAFIASPTAYRALRKMEYKSKVSVFEFDTRFAVYGEDFVLYDYRNPLGVPHSLRERYDVVIADPPYLEEDCLTKVALTIKFITKPDAKIILCTGRVMQDLAQRLMGLRLQKFDIRHDKERLSNPFGCFANYNLDEYCKYT